MRALHGAFTVFFLTCLTYLYIAAWHRERGLLVYGAMAALALEGAFVGVNGGDCPLGRVHRRYGDNRDFFELLMPRRMSKRAVPALAGVAVLGILLVLLRPPRHAT